MHSRFDPRHWNLLAGLSLVAAGCGARTTAGGDGETESTLESESTVDSDSSSEAPDPLCMNDSDCPPGYNCNAGECEYKPSDGHGGCYSDTECGSLSLCEAYACIDVPTPPECAWPLALAPKSIEVEGALALSFTDVDEDGDAELVVATAQDLRVFDSGAMAPTISPQPGAPLSITAMVSGQLDASPGEDLKILADDTLRTHSSDGALGFGPAAVSASPLEATHGIEVGDFDGQAPDDTLLWGPFEALVVRDNSTLIFSRTGVVAADAGELGELGSGFLLRTNASIERFDLDGNTLADHLSKFLGPVALFESDGQAFDLAVGLVDDWSLFEVWQPLRGPQHDRWGLELAVEQVEVGDLDGDGFDELLLRGAVGQLGILRRAPFMQPDCIEWIPPTFPSPPVEVAVGDHDGDGDDEFAVRLDSGEVVLLDAE